MTNSRSQSAFFIYRNSTAVFRIARFLTSLQLLIEHWCPGAFIDMKPTDGTVYCVFKGTACCSHVFKNHAETLCGYIRGNQFTVFVLFVSSTLFQEPTVNINSLFVPNIDHFQIRINFFGAVIRTKTVQAPAPPPLLDVQLNQRLS